MKTLKQIFITLIFVIGITFSVSAQKKDAPKNQPPPKRDPPRIVIPEKTKEKPPSNDKPKKKNDKDNDSLVRRSEVYFINLAGEVEIL